MALLLLHVSSNSEIQAGDNSYLGHSVLKTGKKKIWQKCVLALKTSAWMFVYKPLAKAEVSGAEMFTPI